MCAIQALKRAQTSVLALINTCEIPHQITNELQAKNDGAISHNWCVNHHLQQLTERERERDV